MRRKIIVVRITIGLIAMIVTPVADVVTPPNPKGKPFEEIWKAIVDLQAQITDLTF